LDDVLKPLCDQHCGGFVPLAELKKMPFKKAKQTTNTDGQAKPQSPVVTDMPAGWDKKPQDFIDKTGRRHLPGPLDLGQLTRICRVNWWHGEKMSLDHLRSGYDKGRKADEQAGRKNIYEPHHCRHHPQNEWIRLTVFFDRPLSQAMPLFNSGFYDRFLRVQYETQDGLRCHLSHHVVAHLSHCRTQLHYDVHLHCLNVTKDRVKDPTIYVTLDCDFLTDAYGRAVDGDHLYASLRRPEAVQPEEKPLLGPTGDGIEGGTFESWFQLDW